MLKVLAFTLCLLSPLYAEELFPSIPMAQAQGLSQQQKKPILVEFSASWCAPCKAMQKTTFTDPTVMEYCRAHFVPLQLDLDKDSDQAKKLGVSVVPTLILLDQGREIDRLSGLQNPQEFLAWLRSAGQGPSQIQLLEQGLLKQPQDANLHYQLAEATSERAMWPESLRECLWAWDHVELVRAQNLLPVRASYLNALLNRLLKAYPEAKTALSQRQAGLQQQLQDGIANDQIIRDWMALSKLLELEPGAADYILKHSHQFDAQQQPVFELLCRQKRWADAGHWLNNPQELAESIWSHRQKLEKGSNDLAPETQKLVNNFARKDCHRQWRELLQALEMAQRDEQVEAVRAWIRLTDPAFQLEPH